MSGRSGRFTVLAAGLLVLALVAVVAVAATGSTSVGTAEGRRPSDILLDTFFTLSLLLLLPAAALFVYGLTQRQAIAREIASGRYPRRSYAAWVFFVLLLSIFAYVGYRRADFRLGGSLGDPLGANQDGRARQPDASAGDADAYQAEFAWEPALVVLALVVVAVLAFLASRRGKPAREPDAEMAEELAELLDDTLEDLRAEPDARRAVVAAYARLERALAAAGVPRRGAETAQEHVSRVLAELEVDPDAVHRLSGLYAEAKFSRHEIDEPMREAAIETLAQIRDELRARALGRAEAEAAEALVLR